MLARCAPAGIDPAFPARAGEQHCRSGYRGVAEEVVPFRRLATIIGRRVSIPVASITAREAAARFSWLARFVGSPTRSPASASLNN